MARFHPEVSEMPMFVIVEGEVEVSRVVARVFCHESWV